MSSNVMLATLNISVWSARKFDSKATMEVKENHGAQQRDIGRFNKRLLPENASSYDAIVKLAGEARQAHYFKTMPYDQMGVRLLPAEVYLEHAEEIRAFKGRYWEAVNAFLNNMDDLKAQARLLLNGLFREEDYPTRDELKSKFDFRFHVLPFPNAADFNVALPEDELERIRESIGRQSQEASAKAMRDLWERLYETVSKMTERLSDPNAVFRDSLVENVRDLAGLLPKMNFAGDKNLANLTKQVEDKLAVHDPETLRRNVTTRANVAQQAAEIQSIMAGFMGIEQPSEFILEEAPAQSTLL